MLDPIVITGIGMVTPLGNDPKEVLRRIQMGECAAKAPANFASDAFTCPVCANIADFCAQDYVSKVKSVRLMNRDAQLAVAAARLALRDANLTIGVDYLAGDIGLYGATGLAGLPLKDVMPLIRMSSATDGKFDISRFGGAGLKAVSPILSFKILGNMPICFVAINEGITGPNAIFTPWEGQGAQAIECGVRAIRNNHARCALVGGCDVKTNELSFLSLQQQGIFDSWQKTGSGVIPGEGSIFLVLEKETSAVARGARIYARLSRMVLRTHCRNTNHASTYCELFKQATSDSRIYQGIISADNGVISFQQDEEAALKEMRISGNLILAPKKQVGDLYAAAAFLQVAIAAQASHDLQGCTLANCFGHGSEQAVFVLEQP